MKTMRLKRIFALFLALAVMSTVIVALPLTVSAASVNDLQTITETTVFNLKDGVTSYDTSGALYYDGKLFIKTDNISGSGGSTFHNPITNTDDDYTNVVRLKQIGNRHMALKVDNGAKITIYCNTRSGRVVAISTSDTNNPKNFVATSFNQQTSFTYTSTSEQILYIASYPINTDGTYPDNVSSGADMYVGAIVVEYETIEPTIYLNKTSVDVAVGGTDTINVVNSENLEKITSTTFESDNSDIATVDDSGTITGVSEGTATITVTASDGTNQATATCAVNVANDIDVNVISSGVTALGTVKLISTEDTSVEYTMESNVIPDVPFGTYTVSAENLAPVTYTLNYPETLDVTPTSRSLTITQSNNEFDTATFSDEVYNKIIGNSVMWGFLESAPKPTSFQKIDSLGSSKYVPIAGSLNSGNSDSEVIAYLTGEKLTGSRTGNFQFNRNTTLRIPVVPGSKVTVVNYSSDTTTTHNCVYSITEDTGKAVQVGDLTDETAGTTFSSVFEYDYIYTGSANGYVDITSLGGGYLSSITVAPKNFDNIIRAEEMSNHGANLRYDRASGQTPTDAYIDEYASVFGENFANLGNKKAGFIWNGNVNPDNADKYVSMKIKPDESGIYKIYLLSENSSDNYRLKLTSGSGAVFEDLAPTYAAKVSDKYYIYTCYAEGLTGGTEYTFEIHAAMDSKAGDPVAVSYAKQTFGAQGVDSGYYTNDDTSAGTKYGVIRFMQGYADTDATRYGFYVVNNNGEITPATADVIESNNTGALNGSGFYADMVEIPDNNNTVYYALPFVEINEDIEYADTISGTVDWNTWVENPTTETVSE